MGVENQHGPDDERPEVYERIPWEMLDRKPADRQWIVYAIAGAIVLGAVAYSFMSNRPPSAPVTVAATPETTAVAAPAPLPAVPVPPPVTNPVVVAEADLYAVDPERAVDRAVGHAEWFVAEFFTEDGSVVHRDTLQALMPPGVPLPAVPEGTRVFVESVRTVEVVDTGPLSHRISMLVRYLVSKGGEDYQRQPAVVATVDVVSTDSGISILGPPGLGLPAIPESLTSPPSAIPPEVAERLDEMHPGAEPIGGWALDGGGWRVAALVVGDDGITRPVSFLFP